MSESNQYSELPSKIEPALKKKKEKKKKKETAVFKICIKAR